MGDFMRAHVRVGVMAIKVYSTALLQLLYVIEIVTSSVMNTYNEMVC